MTSTTVESDLFPADQPVDVRTYLAELWARRDYIRYVAASTLRSQQMNTVLGNLWHLLNPALQITVFYVIFGLVLETNRGVDNYIAFVSVGLFTYQFSTRSFTVGSRSITGNRPLLRSVWFPRAMLPITSSLTQLFAFLPAMFVMLAVCLATGEPPLLTWLAIPAIIILQLVLNFGLAMVFARAGNHVQDIQQILPFIFRFLLYASGVIFLVDSYVENSKYRLLFELNPLYGIVATWRWAVLGYDIAPHVVVYTALVSVASLMVGFWWFRQGERSYTRGT